jgi:hypothetical protein
MKKNVLSVAYFVEVFGVPHLLAMPAATVFRKSRQSRIFCRI